MPHRNDFDFLMGEWTIAHRRLDRRLAGSTTWIEFPGTASARKILEGLGNIDEIGIPLPGAPYVGVTLRLFNPTSQLWSIQWADSRSPGLGPPVIGRFDGCRGVFYGDDTVDGRPIRVRFVWTVISPTSCRWEQAFSADAEATFETNWTMAFTRRI